MQPDRRFRGGVRGIIRTLERTTIILERSNVGIAGMAKLNEARRPCDRSLRINRLRPQSQGDAADARASPHHATSTTHPFARRRDRECRRVYVLQTRGLGGEQRSRLTPLLRHRSTAEPMYHRDSAAADSLPICITQYPDYIPSYRGRLVAWTSLERSQGRVVHVRTPTNTQ